MLWADLLEMSSTRQRIDNPRVVSRVSPEPLKSGHIRRKVFLIDTFGLATFRVDRPFYRLRLWTKKEPPPQQAPWPKKTEEAFWRRATWGKAAHTGAWRGRPPYVIMAFPGPKAFPEGGPGMR
jgi:hypothetical protein